MGETGSQARPQQRDSSAARFTGRRRLSGRLTALAGVGAGTLFTLSGCSLAQAFSFGWPVGGISRQSQRMFDVWLGSVIAAVVVGVFVWGLIFWCVVRYRKRGDELPPQTRYNLPIELLYSVTPFLIIAVLFYYTAVVESDVNEVRPDPDVTVQVEAFQWNWKFTYQGVEGPDGRDVSTLGTTTYVPVLVLPTNERVLFLEHSADVIHSFWVPEMLFKRDVFPGNVVNEFEATLEQPGAYVGRCAELCGTYHAMMNFELRVVTPDKFQAFLAAKQAGKSTPEALAAIGEAPLAVTTEPFPSKRNADALYSG